MKKKFTCPICEKTYFDHPATSRTDNKSDICTRCAMLEALSIFNNHIENSDNEEY